MRQPVTSAWFLLLALVVGGPASTTVLAQETLQQQKKDALLKPLAYFLPPLDDIMCNDLKSLVAGGIPVDCSYYLSKEEKGDVQIAPADPEAEYARHIPEGVGAQNTYLVIHTKEGSIFPDQYLVLPPGTKPRSFIVLFRQGPTVTDEKGNFMTYFQVPPPLPEEYGQISKQPIKMKVE